MTVPASIRVALVPLGPPEPVDDECPVCFRSMVAQAAGWECNGRPTQVSTFLVCVCGFADQR